MRKIIAFIGLFLLAPAAVQTQFGQDISKQVWIDVNPQYYLNSNSKIYGDVGARRELADRVSFRSRGGERSDWTGVLTVRSICGSRSPGSRKDCFLIRSKASPIYISDCV